MSIGWPKNLTMAQKNTIKEKWHGNNPFISGTLTLAKGGEEILGIWHGLC